MQELAARTLIWATLSFGIGSLCFFVFNVLVYLSTVSLCLFVHLSVRLSDVLSTGTAVCLLFGCCSSDPGFRPRFFEGLVLSFVSNNPWSKHARYCWYIMIYQYFVYTAICSMYFLHQVCRYSGSYSVVSGTHDFDSVCRLAFRLEGLLKDDFGYLAFVSNLWPSLIWSLLYWKLLFVSFVRLLVWFWTVVVPSPTCFFSICFKIAFWLSLDFISWQLWFRVCLPLSFL